MYLVMPADHPLATRRRVRLADLAGEAWIGGQPDCECNRLIQRACAVAGYEPRFTFETDDYTAMQGFIAAGVGVSLIAELGLTTVRDDVVVRDLGRDTPVRQIYAVTLDEGYLDPIRAVSLALRVSRRRGHLRLSGALPSAPRHQR